MCSYNKARHKGDGEAPASHLLMESNRRLQGGQGGTSVGVRADALLPYII
jgi:hypothetical protein